MKYFWIPAAVLALLLALSLANARAVDADAARWRAALGEASAAAERADWDAASDALRAAKADWDARRQWLHVVTAHDELEAADALFATAALFARRREATEFCAALAELDAQLRVVSEMQRLTLRNTL